MNKQRGISLIELLISLSLASFILLLLIQQYVWVKQNYQRMQNEWNEMNDLQAIVDLMRDRVQHAGFTPCANVEQLKTIDPRDGHALFAIATQDDRLLINYMSESFALVFALWNNQQLVIAPSQALAEQLRERPIIIADCYHAEIDSVAMITSMRDGILITLRHPLRFNYHSPIYVGEWVQSSFFMRKTSQNERSLFYQHDRADALSSIIKNFVVQLQSYAYGILATIHFELKDAHTFDFDSVVRSR